jgi:ribosomal RNA large subunit methyltransferase H
MTFKLLAVGKTSLSSLEKLIDDYKKRINFYTKFDIEIIENIKNTKNISEEEQKSKEGSIILQKISPNDILILLDERGKEFSSIEFSNFIQKIMNTGVKQCIFLIGGAYGFSEQIYARANHICSLSKMTFSHQMVRLFFTEQLYRAFTILNNEPYHHS